ncbi:MAG: serpin family protein [Phycisphaeraceae bacterium]|nr:serpin family protein [Phycisphaerae bacterium]MBX3393570.1 serpin family protein [Phycisphaeraceae bacterium]HRJ49191.1 serpin family protein [Phycisphaerales bacterium]
MADRWAGQPLENRRAMLGTMFGREWVGIAAAMVIAAGCASRTDSAPLPPPLPREPPEARPERIASQNAWFASDLLRTLEAGESGNVFFSPHSLSTALAMAWAGARGQTERAIASTMRWSDGQQSTHDGFASLANRLAPPTSESGAPAYEWTSANRLWLGMPVSDSFSRTLADSYASDTSSLNLKDATDSARAINQWAGLWTRGRITRIVEPDDINGLPFVLTNAVYFKGLWTTPFNTSSTRPEPFHTADGTVAEVPMMHAVREVMHAAGDGWQSISLPYNGGISCLLYQVDHGSMTPFLGAMDGDFIERSRSRMRPRMADMAIPRFSIRTKFSAAEALGTLGMGVAFSDAADFSGITGAAPLAISDVIHAATIEFDEVGTVATAVTAIGIRVTSAPMPEDPVVFRLDHPFVIAIVHDATGAVLFLGRVNDPGR